MSMWIAGSVMVGTTMLQVTESRKSRDLQERMQADAEARADKNAKEADIAMGKQNQKRPDIVGALDNNKRAAMGSTMLTGAGGVTDPLPLSKQTLLGS